MALLSTVEKNRLSVKRLQNLEKRLSHYAYLQQLLGLTERSLAFLSIFKQPHCTCFEKQWQGRLKIKKIKVVTMVVASKLRIITNGMYERFLVIEKKHHCPYITFSKVL